MKERPPLKSYLLSKFRQIFAGTDIKLRLAKFADDSFVRLGYLPEKMDGLGKILHISDTPTTMYGYLARTLRRVSPSVVVHTGDLADDIKLGLYPTESGRYANAARKLINILLAPHRRVLIVLGNHDRADLLPSLPAECSVHEGAVDVKLSGANFRISHYAEKIMEKPVQYNLFGHDLSSRSFVDGEGRYFLNGIEMMRLIDPGADEIKMLVYPRCTDGARMMRAYRSK
ncbi:MAG: metallophosphoesterase [Synergistaceae bacterium]|jgi:3',5'-cyclic AMP phosphodiesterase CpdA|nr:metallophosphoesterase [Synergistaceae bacterium]